MNSDYEPSFGLMATILAGIFSQYRWVWASVPGSEGIPTQIHINNQLEELYTSLKEDEEAEWTATGRLMVGRTLENEVPTKEEEAIVSDALKVEVKPQWTYDVYLHIGSIHSDGTVS